MASGTTSILPISIGVTVAAFASGFGVCLFDIGTVHECVALANSWVDTFRDMGNQIIVWALSILHTASAPPK